MIETARLTLRPWRDADAEPFAAMHADPEVMHDHPAPLTPVQSEAKFARYRQTYDRAGFGRMALEGRDGAFLGYVGIMPLTAQHPLGPSVEIGWRLVRRAWGHGYAAEAGAALLADGFDRLEFDEVIAYTTPVNLRSQAVMSRLGMKREPHRDCTVQVDSVPYRLVVSTARPSIQGDHKA